MLTETAIHKPAQEIDPFSILGVLVNINYPKLSNGRRILLRPAVLAINYQNKTSILTYAAGFTGKRPKP
jgi:hypothetical protein